MQVPDVDEVGEDGRELCAGEEWVRGIQRSNDWREEVLEIQIQYEHPQFDLQEGLCAPSV